MSAPPLSGVFQVRYEPVTSRTPDKQAGFGSIAPVVSVFASLFANKLMAGLARDAHVGDEIVRTGSANTASAHATIAVAIKNMTFVVDGDFVEVEQIALKVAAALLPNSGPGLNRVVRRGVDGGPGFAAVISRGDERIPAPGKTQSLVIAGDICAEEADRCAARAAADGFDFSRVHNAVSRTEIEVVRPRNRVAHRVEMSYLHPGVTFRWLALSNRLIVHVRIVNRAVGIDRDGRISARPLRNSSRHLEGMPGCAGVGAEQTALHSAALRNRQPNCAVGRDVKVAVQSAAISVRRTWSLAGVGQNRRAVAGTEIVAAITSRRTHNVLRTIVNRLPLIDWSCERAQQRGIRSAPDRFVIGAVIWRGDPERRPIIAVIIAVSINCIRANG